MKFNKDNLSRKTKSPEQFYEQFQLALEVVEKHNVNYKKIIKQCNLLPVKYFDKKQNYNYSSSYFREWTDFSGNIFLPNKDEVKIDVINDKKIYLSTDIYQCSPINQTLKLSKAILYYNGIDKYLGDIEFISLIDEQDYIRSYYLFNKQLRVSPLILNINRLSQLINYKTYTNINWSKDKYFNFKIDHAFYSELPINISMIKKNGMLAKYL